MRDGASGKVQKIVIVGGGTAGWMTAAALSQDLLGTGVSITLVESAEIGTVGVGEATLPQIRRFNERLGLDEADVMRKTSATIKLAIEFRDWGKIGDRYMHPFGDYGDNLGDADFHHYWLKQFLSEGGGKGNGQRFGDYCYPIVSATRGRFSLPPDDPVSALETYSYAFQFDALAYGRYLADYASAKGVQRIEGKVVEVHLNHETGFIKSIQLEDQSRIDGDLFVDCTGFRGVLIEQALNTGYEDWSCFLPCNRAIAVACAMKDDLTPYTRATAREAGWQWRIPLQHRVGNGHVYCDKYISDDEALYQLMSTLEGEPLSEPKQLFFTTGKRRKFWNKNCVAIGLSAGFLEPLESTSIDLIQSGIMNLLELLPSKNCDEIDCNEYNQRMDLEFALIRDFLLLHYVANQRNDAPFWRDMREMKWPDSLRQKVTAFQKRGLVPNAANGLFQRASWLSVLIGQNIIPETYDPRADKMHQNTTSQSLRDMRETIARSVEQSQDHLKFLDEYGALQQHSLLREGV